MPAIKTFLLSTLFSALFILGCNSPATLFPERDVVGKWELNKSATKKALSEDLVMMADAVDLMELELQINVDQTYGVISSARGVENRANGDWKVLSTSGNLIELEMKDKEREKPQVWRFTFSGQDSVSYQRGKGSKMSTVLDRVK